MDVFLSVWFLFLGTILDVYQSLCFCFLFSDIRVEDEGLYTCVAQNPFGKTDASAFVSVTGIGAVSYTHLTLPTRSLV